MMRPPRRLPAVPNITRVVPGAAVHIVLKQDQPTGRTVEGTVQNVLTRGNHPRGIKVRLSDGRVGRVQAMATGGAPPPAVPPVAAGAGMADMADAMSAAAPGDRPTEQIGLDAYIRPAKSKQRRGGTGSQAATTSAPAAAAAAASGPSVTCPVCGAFEGDEAAVSHHVATHFEG